MSNLVKFNNYEYLPASIRANMLPIQTAKQHQYAVSLYKQVKDTPTNFEDTKNHNSIGSLKIILGDGIVYLVRELLREYFLLLGSEIDEAVEKILLKNLFTHPDTRLLSISDIKLALFKMAQKKHYGKPVGADYFNAIVEYQIDRTDYFDNKHYSQHQSNKFKNE